MRREATQQVGLRIPASLLSRIDQHAARLRRETKLPTISRTDAALALISLALDALESAERKPRGRRLATR